MRTIGFSRPQIIHSHDAEWQAMPGDGDGLDNRPSSAGERVLDGFQRAMRFDVSVTGLSGRYLLERKDDNARANVRIDNTSRPLPIFLPSPSTVNVREDLSSCQIELNNGFPSGL
jgi:hypothetical protein